MFPIFSSLHSISLLGSLRLIQKLMPSYSSHSCFVLARCVYICLYWLRLSWSVLIWCFMYAHVGFHPFLPFVCPFLISSFWVKGIKIQSYMIGMICICWKVPCLSACQQFLVHAIGNRVDFEFWVPWFDIDGTSTELIFFHLFINQ